ncbi:MAG: CDP-alcohol phosphatidyltransferase family protein [Bdellovibrionales bacterium]|nr:CDP-alcohol phosphatidyltransferase family protein [Bdellovibrionales bacterium]
MVSVYDVKPAFQNLLRPLCSWLAVKSVTANQVTLAALLLSVIFGLALFSFPTTTTLYYGMPIVLFVRMALNAIDGMLAREHGMKTKFGAYLNELADVVSDIGLYLPFCVALQGQSEIVIGLILLACIVEFAGVLGYSVGSVRQYQGPMGKSDRALFFGILSLLVASGYGDYWIVPVVLWLMLGLSLMTVNNRIKAGLQA